MDTWARIRALAKSGQSGFSKAFLCVLKSDRPSTLFVIQHSESPERLVQVLSERFEDIVTDNECLAHVRILASSFMLKAFMQSLQRLDSDAAYFRKEAASLHQMSSTIWLRLTGIQPANLARAERYERNVAALESITEVIHQFFGMHMETTTDIRVALESERPDDLARAIVAASSQASTFMDAVAQSTNSDDLRSRISDAVRSSIGVAPRRNVSDQMHVAGQLGQFWNHNGTSNSSKALGTHDVRLILQILQKELSDLTSTQHRMRMATEKDISLPWGIQRRPVRYTGIVGISAAASRTIVLRSSFLGGSGELEEYVQIYSQVLTNFVARNVYEPITGFYQQVFKSTPSSANEESVAVARASLKDVLVDFSKENLAEVVGADELAMQGSMKAVMDVFKDQIKYPLRNAVFGNLGQIVILQVQKLKCDVEELMLKSKQLLRAQELNLTLVALVPSLLTVTALVYITSMVSLQWRSRGTEMIVSVPQTARFLLSDIHNSLLTVEAEQQSDQSIDSVLRHIKQLGTLHMKICELEDLTHRGVIRAAPSVLQRFAEDLDLLRSAEIPFEYRRKHLERILFCYPFLRGA